MLLKKIAMAFNRSFYFDLQSKICNFQSEFLHPKIANQLDLLEVIDKKLLCYHCGDECPDESIHINDKIFCCNGCKIVFELLDTSNLCEYYSIDSNPGVTRKYHSKRNYDFLDDTDLKSKLIDFTNGTKTIITFEIPQMHCSSCIWILENLYKLEPGVISSKVNFLQKKIFITYLEEKTSLKKVVELLDSIGYEPLLNLEEKKEEKIKEENKSLYYKIGIAGFCFGNIMLLSFPEYLSINVEQHTELKRIFAYLNLILALPVFFYSASDYFISSWKGLKKRIINIDLPLAIGIAALFIRSIIDIIFLHEAGFLDSLAGLVFFLLIGKLFQSKTYDTLNFERNYKSYFPIAVTTRKNGIETTIPVEKLSPGSRIIIRNGELIPADSILIKGEGNIDYSFVTGESIPLGVKNGEMIFAGGKQAGSAIEVEVVKEVSQSYLTQLWNNKAFHKSTAQANEHYEYEESRITSFSNTVSKYFTIAVIGLSAAAFLIWLPDISLAFNAFTAVLIVACPCALALSSPFTFGNAMRIFGKNKFYLKNTHVVEKFAHIDSIVFDKTGTITESGNSDVSFIGDELSDEDKELIKVVVNNSTHPLSVAINNSILIHPRFNAVEYSEEPGKGISALVKGNRIKMGSQKFVHVKEVGESAYPSTRVYISINGIGKGYFLIQNKYRTGLEKLISSLEQEYEIGLLSGDNEGEKNNLRKLFGDDNELHFNQSPYDKLEFISRLQKNGKKVLMIGDGLNDAGALRQSDIGISISDDTGSFFPACDGILDSKSFPKLNRFLKFSKTSKKILVASFIFSSIYNLIGLSFAFNGSLSPLVAAILMPVSSISVVVFSTVSVNLLAKKRGLL